MSERDASLAPGTVVGARFRIERSIGKGGMGEVYAAKHVNTGRDVALKLIHAAAARGEDARRRFLREARAATAIEHPSCIEVLDVFEDDDGTPVMVMELLKGESFAAHRARVGALRLFEAAAILVPVAEALVAAHAKGIVHRDLKPDNIFLAIDARGKTTPKVLDFGIAKVLDPGSLGSETHGQATNTGSILGTPHYMSYEQAMSDKTVDHRTDVWSMGVILFEALCGRRPIEFDTLGQMYVSFLQGVIPRIRDLVPTLPADVADVVDRCLQKERHERLDSLDAYIAVLRKYENADTPGARAGGVAIPSSSALANPNTASAMSRSSSNLRTSSGRRRWIAGGAALALIVGTTAFVVAQNRAVTGGQTAITTASSASIASPSAIDTAVRAPSSEPLPANVVDGSSGFATSALPSIAKPRTSSALAPSTAPSGRVLAASVAPSVAAPAISNKGIVEKLPY